MRAADNIPLRLLTERIRAIESRSALSTPTASVAMQGEHGAVLATGWHDIDATLGGGLHRAGLHEWFGMDDSDARERKRHPVKNYRMTWSPPVALMAHLAWRVVDESSQGGWAVWIGRHSFPYSHALVRGDYSDRRLLDRSLLVAAQDINDRLWAAEVALRCSAVQTVITDGSHFNMQASRRLQLLARQHGKFVLCIRPPLEQGELSAAQTRWRVRWTPSETHSFCPRWTVELLRCKGSWCATDRAVWALELHHATGLVCASATLAGSDRQAPTRARARPA